MLFFPLARLGRNDGLQFVLAPCVPALFYAAHDIGRTLTSTPAPSGSSLLLMGASGYAVAGALVTGIAVLAFERLTGRLEARPTAPARTAAGASSVAATPAEGTPSAGSLADRGDAMERVA
jgi:hypothetical protein